MGRLVFKRKLGEAIRIGDEIEITVLEIREGSMRLSILAPTDVPVHRLEVWKRIQEEGERGRAKVRAAEAGGAE